MLKRMNLLPGSATTSEAVPAGAVRWGWSWRIRLQGEGLQGQIDLAEEALRLGLGRRTGRWYEASSTVIEPVPIPPRLTL